MPIYAYRCESCGFTKDVLQKISDAPLTDCPTCGAVSFKKQLTAAGFQLKGSGWYVTDFRNNGASAPASAAAKPAAETPSGTASSGSESGSDGGSKAPSTASNDSAAAAS